jgi:hypothetical protein
MNEYEKGIKITEEEFNALDLIKDSFHGEWNYKIRQKSGNKIID